jgi:tetratricopeptide (TPR) repeat protein
MRERRDSNSEPPNFRNFMVPYQENRRFVGRTELLQKLHEMLCEVAPKQDNHRVALYGTGGVGKTQAALAYVYAHENDYERIYWISAENEASLLSGFDEIATRTRCTKRMNHCDPKLLAKAVLAWLKQQNSWLVIIDNLDRIELIDGLLPDLAPGKHTLITTRNQDVRGIPARGLEVPLPDSNEAIEMLYTLSEMESDYQTEEAEKLVQELGQLPLAIEQAASYVREISTSFAAFLDNYRTRRKDLHKWQPSGNRHYSHSIATTWSISFKVVQEKNPLAAKLFQVLSFLNPDRILLDFILAGKAAFEDGLKELLSDDISLAGALSSLQKLSLLKWSRESKVVSIHRLIQAAVIDDLSEERLRACMSSVVGVCAAAFPTEVTNETRPLCRQYQDQVIGPLLHCVKLRTVETARVMRRVGYLLMEDGQYADSVRLLSHAVEIFSEVMGIDNLRTLNEAGVLTWISHQLGLWNEVDKLQEGDVKINADALTAMDNLAAAYQKHGKWDDAAALHKKTLAARKKFLGEAHADTLASMNNLSVTYWGQGRWEHAVALHKKTLAARKEVLGIRHPDTLMSMNNLAATYQEQGRWTDSAALKEETLAARKDVLGEEHPDTLKTMNNLAVTYQGQGRWEHAVALHKKTLALRKKVFGDHHPDTLMSMNNLAVTYLDQRRCKEAAALHVETLAARRRLLGEDHPDIWKSMNNLALAYQELGRLDDAMTLLEKTVATRTTKSGKDHPETVRAMTNLGVIYRKIGRREEARALHKKAQSINQLIRGEQHPDTLYTMVELAETYHCTGQRSAATRLMEKTWVVSKKVFGEHHPETVRAESRLETMREEGEMSEENATIENVDVGEMIPAALPNVSRNVDDDAPENNIAVERPGETRQQTATENSIEVQTLPAALIGVLRDVDDDLIEPIPV